MANRGNGGEKSSASFDDFSSNVVLKTVRLTRYIGIGIKLGTLESIYKSHPLTDIYSKVESSG